MDPDGNNENGDEDLVDAAESVEFFVAGSQIIGIDQAVIQAIERCCKFLN